MEDNKHYYDEQIKSYYYERNIESFNKVKSPLKDFSLNTLLSLNTKPILTEIAKRLDIKGYSKLGKDALVNLISENITSNCKDLLKSLSYKELYLLNSLAKKDTNKYTFLIKDLAPIGGLTSLGLLHKISLNSELLLIVPTDLKDSITSLGNSKKYMSALKEDNKDLFYIDGLITNFGLVHCPDIYDLIINNSNTLLKEEKLTYYLDYIFRCYEVYIEANTLMHPYIFSPENLYKEIEVRPMITYDYDNIDKYIALGEDFTTSWGEEVTRLIDFLTIKRLKKDTINRVVTELIFYIKNDFSTASLLDLLQESGVTFKTNAEAEEIIDILTNLYNNTPMWILKGLTPSELSKMRTTPIKKEKEPGRNDPCPCGSGKKYKKCCGKN